MLYFQRINLLRKSLALALVFLLVPALHAALPNVEKMLQWAQAHYGSRGVVAVNEWKSLMAQSRNLAENEQLSRVNDFFNHKILFRDDSEIWGKPDYWATPLETLGRGQGDCEDFAIAKYVTLREQGIPTDRLRLVYVRAITGGAGSSVSQAHMVLAYYPSPSQEPLILDNLIGEIRPASRRNDLFPVFSFNSEGLWVGNRSSGTAPESSTARLSRWRDVIARMQAEGIE